MTLTLLAAVIERLRRVLPALWAGLLLCIAGLATRAPMALLDKADAGRVVGSIFLQEAWLSLALALLLLAIERTRARRAAQRGQGSILSAEMLLVLGTAFCTVLGYFVVQPLLVAARAGQGGMTFGQLHAVSLSLFGLKTVLVLVLAWRAAKPA